VDEMQEQIKRVRLNFYPIIPQEFEFKIWRKEYQEERKEGIFENLYRNSLPINDDLETRSDYWISFISLQNFEEFACNQHCNRKLTQHFLYYLLSEKAKTALRNHEYIVPIDTFRKEVLFIIKEHPEGKEALSLEPYFLQPANKFGFLIDYQFCKHTDVPFSRIIQKLSLSLDNSFRSNRNFYIDKYQKIQEFFRNFEKRISPLKFGGSQINISTTPEDLPTEMLETKKYVFGNGVTDTSQYKGIEQNGPLEGLNRPITLMLIYRKKDIFLVDDLIKALKGESHGVLFTGLEKIFKLKAVVIEKIPVDEFSETTLNTVVEKVLSKKETAGDISIMPVLIGDKDDEKTYYSMKYKLLEGKLPLQVVTAQLIGRGEALKWSVSNIALQIFAKVGGKPWKVLASDEKTLIFGIGQAHQKSSGLIIKYFAYSVCTDSSGLYKKISVLGRSDNETSYLQQLKTNIIATIEEYLDGEYNKFVLHIPFKTRKSELNVIYETIKDFVKSKRLPNLDFVVLRVNAKNKFFGYAYTNSLVPYESTYTLVSYSPRAYLVWLEGLQFHRATLYKRVSGPVYIEFYWSNRELEENERKNYLQDVLNLSGANWRGFNAKNLPVSIYYCQLVADFVKNFDGEIQDIENISNPWFL
jgi:hypothetical protein